MAGPPPPAGVTIADYGIAGTHLAFDVSTDVDELLLIDTVPANTVPANAVPAGAVPAGAVPAGAVPGGGLDCAGTLRVLELAAAPPPADRAGRAGSAADGVRAGAAGPPPSAGDGHAMTPEAVLRLVDILGGRLDRVLLVGCVPACLDDGIGLSGPVTAAVEPAVDLVRALFRDGLPAPGARAPAGEPASGHLAGTVTPNDGSRGAGLYAGPSRGTDTSTGTERSQESR
jgi:hydrogenase maturation protease